MTHKKEPGAGMSWKRYGILAAAALLAGSIGGALFAAWIGGRQTSREGVATLVIATAAAVLVAWQSWETRKSAHAAASAAITANSAIELSRSALEIARTEERHTRYLIVEGIKNRIDSNAYSLTVLADPSVVWPPFEPSISGGVPNPLPADVVYRLPRDGDKRIIVRAKFRIINEGSRLVLFRTTDPWVYDDGRGNYQTFKADKYQLDARDKSWGYFEVNRTVAEWAEIATYRMTGQSIEEAVRSITVSDDSDTGTIDWYDIQIGGTPLVAIDGEQGSWRLQPGQYTDYEQNFPVMGVEALPRRRVYYLSKRIDLLLDKAFGSDLGPK